MAMLTGLGLAALGLLVVMAGEGGHGPGEAKPQESWWPWRVEVALGLLVAMAAAAWLAAPDRPWADGWKHSSLRLSGVGQIRARGHTPAKAARFVPVPVTSCSAMAVGISRWPWSTQNAPGRPMAH